MNINNSYISLDWNKLSDTPVGNDDEIAGFFFSAIDEELPWLIPVPFGNEIDHYYFQSWNGLMEFNDWFRDQRREMNKEVIDPLAALFMDFGLLHEDTTFTPNPIKKGITFTSGWLIGAIPPPEVKALLARAESLDLDSIQSEFHLAIQRMPCDMVPNKEMIQHWILSLITGLRSTISADRGIIIGAA
ncbi:MAG: hypothetical protein K0R17_93 [Rariglobus sp.]|jgi:hypothetical protein|nr:hypothetical protein [Rariglobus sp.]